MQAGIKFTAILVAAISVSACGFKSDLSIPGDRAKDVDDLIVPDSELVEAELPPGALEERPPFLPSDDTEGVEVPLTDEEIIIEKATTAASDGDILVDPDSTTDTTSEDSNFETGDSNSDSESGVEVDISDLTTELRGDSPSQ